MGYDKLSHETDPRDAEIERLKAEVVTQDEDIETYKSEHVRLITLKDTLRARVESQEEEIEILKAELAMANKLWNQAESKLEEVMGSDRIGYKADPYPIIDALTAQIKLAQNDRDEQVDEVARLESLLDSRTSQLHAAIGERNSVESRNDRLLTRVKELEKQPRNFYAKYLASVEKTNQLRAKVEELQGNNSALMNRVEELTREVDMYNGITLGEVVKELKLSQTCRDQAVDQLAECEKERDELRTEVERRGGYMDELAEEVDRLREELELERADHYSTVKKLGNRAVNAELKQLRQLNAEKAEALKEMQDKNDELRILNGQQVFEIEKYAAEVLELREKLASAECDLDTVDQENIYLDAQREVLQKRLDDAYSVISHLSAKPVGPVQELPKQPTIELRPQLLSNKKMQEMLDQCAEQLKRDRERR